MAERIWTDEDWAKDAIITWLMFVGMDVEIDRSQKAATARVQAREEKFKADRLAREAREQAFAEKLKADRRRRLLRARALKRSKITSEAASIRS